MSDIVFSIAPKINAAGRIAHAKKSVEILVEQDYDKAKIIAMEIDPRMIAEVGDDTRDSWKKSSANCSKSLLLIFYSLSSDCGMSSGSIPGTKVIPACCFQSWG